MIGPHHSIICCLIGTGQGAAAWNTWVSEEVSYLARTSGGNFSIRTKWVGTHCAVVTLKSWMQRRASSGSKRSISTTVPPIDCTAIDQPSGAAWYSGAGER